ncbi:hypothetical protein CJF42_03275 [Pseudoalteromonas sp. NBT06-2]|uniref:5-oxoprolinase subunit PxpA n=1 Tax=Pseudoalteromonas sp. NBT06-2 TaxID=2025950 RepID=UPI000BA55EAC|nr:5-oxoprolinase subunit PxpA [Pseudoalteromonas sp. NBT06-2]PAJ75789.1 hypothetical protein CJF42_03275 [Pseudoalteromonas sp. NBT06-2]
MKLIDINCDLGEGVLISDCEQDATLMPYISSCNIACGGHAGNESIIRKSLLNARLHKLKIGAHPGYEDKENFGRISLAISINELIDSIKRQLDSFFNISSELNIAIHHIKFHGALYNDLEKKPKLSLALAQLLIQDYSEFKVYGLANGVFEKCCIDLNIDFIAEGFMDRTYTSTGLLTPRSEKNAMITAQDKSIAQAVLLASNKEVTTSDNQVIKPNVKTICLHGDNPNAVAIAKALHKELTYAGFIIQ